MTHKCKHLAAVAVFCCLACYSARAQNEDDFSGSLFSRPQAVGLTAGTQGLGLDFTQAINPGVSVRLGGSYLPFSFKYRSTFSQVATDVKLKAQSFANAHLLVDIFPSMELGFRITPGIAYFFNAKGVAEVSPTGTYKYGDINVPGSMVGNMEGTIKWNGVAPYLGAGWLFNFKGGESPLALSIDAGTYFLPKPEATLTGTNLLQNNAYNQEQFKENVKNYRWLPLAQLSLRYRY